MRDWWRCGRNWTMWLLLRALQVWLRSDAFLLALKTCLVPLAFSKMKSEGSHWEIVGVESAVHQRAAGRATRCRTVSLHSDIAPPVLYT